MVARAAVVDTGSRHLQKRTHKVVNQDKQRTKSPSCSGPLAEDRYEACQALVHIH